MTGIADIALGAAPIAGGALVGVIAGGLKGPDFRGMIRSDIELLDKIPPENARLRAELEASINRRIQDLIISTEKSRDLIQVAASYKGNWRDFVVFLCAVLFTLVWWNIPHERTNWLPMFIVLLVLSALVGFYACRGIIRALSELRHRR
ncbi:MAG: hypothetical protein QG655_876 [Actinomycetota bacterium]|jgi:hypothetical protein|nr:hypothetical protein [Actinomycetota bacterium]HPY23492.1 hypothetical protein [Mycobacterium sp.]